MKRRGEGGKSQKNGSELGGVKFFLKKVNGSELFVMNFLVKKYLYEIFYNEKIHEKSSDPLTFKGGRGFWTVVGSELGGVNFKNQKLRCNRKLKSFPSPNNKMKKIIT